MKVLSLFSGGSLGDYGLTLAGMEISGQVEINEYCQKILKLRWPDVPKWRDIRDVKGDAVIKAIGRPDIISGGFPCQDISFANANGEGLSGKRSGLWKEYFRLICEIRPRWVFVENVSALLVRGLGTVLSDLASAGYDSEWACIPASAIGAPHRRDRVWILGYTVNNGQPAAEIKRSIDKGSDDSEAGAKQASEPSGPSKQYAELAYTNSLRVERSGAELQTTGAGREGKTIPNTKSTGQPRCFTRQGKIELRRSYTRNRECGGGIWTAEPPVGRVANGIADRVDRLKLLGNGQVVQIVQWIGERIMEYEKRT